jgi:hypothetical protein
LQMRGTGLEHYERKLALAAFLSVQLCTKRLARYLPDRTLFTAFVY